MLTVIAIGGNALLQRGQPLEAALLRKNVKVAADSIAPIAKQHSLAIVHGNGPQVGLLALQSQAYKKVHTYPLDILDAESQGMIGYLIQQELGSRVPNKDIITLLTQVVVDEDDPAFLKPTKFIGPIYDEQQYKNIKTQHDWTFKKDGDAFRRVVPSPKPKHIYELNGIKKLLRDQSIVIAGGGGGIPCIASDANSLVGVEAVIDKDRTASLLAKQLDAHYFVILTDVDAIYENFGTANAKAIKTISPTNLRNYNFAAGSMAPKVLAACEFVEAQKRPAMIGNLAHLSEILAGHAGTRIENEIATQYYSV